MLLYDFSWKFDPEVRHSSKINKICLVVLTLAEQLKTTCLETRDNTKSIY